MECLNPINIRRPNGRSSSDRIVVPCGRCATCLQRKQAEWLFRLDNELRHSFSAYFVTLTYSQENIPFNVDTDTGVIQSTVQKRDIQLFMKRLRKTQKRQIRYYLCAEYGTKTKRPHYHAIIFNIEGGKAIAEKKLLDAWKLGHIHIGQVSERSIRYTTKYVLKRVFTPNSLIVPLL